MTHCVALGNDEGAACKALLGRVGGGLEPQHGGPNL